VHLNFNVIIECLNRALIDIKTRRRYFTKCFSDVRSSLDRIALEIMFLFRRRCTESTTISAVDPLMDLEDWSSDHQRHVQPVYTVQKTQQHLQQKQAPGGQQSFLHQYSPSDYFESYFERRRSFPLVSPSGHSLAFPSCPGALTTFQSVRSTEFRSSTAGSSHHYHQHHQPQYHHQPTLSFAPLTIPKRLGIASCSSLSAISSGRVENGANSWTESCRARESDRQGRDKLASSSDDHLLHNQHLHPVETDQDITMDDDLCLSLMELEELDDSSLFDIDQITSLAAWCSTSSGGSIATGSCAASLDVSATSDALTPSVFVRHGNQQQERTLCQGMDQCSRHHHGYQHQKASLDPITSSIAEYGHRESHGYLVHHQQQPHVRSLKLSSSSSPRQFLASTSFDVTRRHRFTIDGPREYQLSSVPTITSMKTSPSSTHLERSATFDIGAMPTQTTTAMAGDGRTHHGGPDSAARHSVGGGASFGRLTTVAPPTTFVGMAMVSPAPASYAIAPSELPATGSLNRGIGTCGTNVGHIADRRKTATVGERCAPHRRQDVVSNSSSYGFSIGEAAGMGDQRGTGKAHHYCTSG